MSLRLADKLAVVTGGTNGIGLSIVETFSREGATVVFTGRNLERGEAAEAATGGKFIALDVTDPEHAEKLVAAALGVGKRIDILVNNAGGAAHRGGVETIAADHLDEAMAVHLRAPWLAIARVAPVMRAAGGGSIINICSVAAQRVGAHSTPYAVTKAALLHLTRCAAAELGGDGIRVNSVSPGFIKTSIHASWLKLNTEPAHAEGILDFIAQSFVRRQVIPQSGQPNDVSEAVLYLASDESKFVTGTDLVIDGGLMWGQVKKF